MEMLRLPVPVVAFALALGLYACQPFTARKAAAVNDEVVDAQQQVVEALEQFIDALEKRDAALLGTSRQALTTNAEAGLERLESLAAPRCDGNFLAASREHFNFYLGLADGDYAHLVRYLAADSITYEQFDSLQALIARAEEARQAADAAFLEAQRDFARNCGLKLVAHDE